MTETASIAERRRQAISEAMEKVRDIERRSGVTRDSLEQIKDVLIALGESNGLFTGDDFPSPGDEPLMYLLSEDDDHRFALYLSSGRPGRPSPPHNHTTWAVITGLEGEEENRIYERVDDGSQPGKGEVRVRDKFVVKAGTSIAFLPDDIHSIHVVSDVPTRHFHMYGLSIEHLPNRIEFDTEKGTCKVFPASRGIKKGFG